jgi:thymidylate synthase (FAD)
MHICDEKHDKEKFIRHVVSSGHLSPLEHVKFTFAVQGVSRALTHQLVRHRIASYSQQSQRYVKEDAFEYIIPPSIRNDPAMHAAFEETMKHIQNGYNHLLQGFKEQGIKGEKANQDARFVLPQACETKIVMTMNARELLHFFEQRCCTRAQWEIRELADRIRDICRENLECVFEHAGAKCEALGYCPESPRFSCGRYPVRNAEKTPGDES